MREKIILATIKLLDNSGVKFTIDDIKEQLKISKKTVYKYFTSKEELAQAVFDYIIEKSRRKQEVIMCGDNDAPTKIVLCLNEYMEIYRLQSEKIFNLYSLNLKLLADIGQKVDEDWEEILAFYHTLKDDIKVKTIDDKLFRIIIEGIFQKIYHRNDRSKIGYDCLKVVLEKC